MRFLESTVIVKTNFYTGDEDEENLPIAGTDFYLFEENPASLLKKGKFKLESADDEQTEDTHVNEQDYLTALARAFSSGDVESALIAVLIKENLFKPNSRRLKTDRAGQIQIKEIVPGKYYLFGIAENGAEIFLWNLPIELKGGDNLIEIDQYNAEIVLPVE